MDSNSVTRRRLLGSLGAAGVVGLAGCGGGDGGDGADGGDGGDGGTPTDTPGDGGTTTPSEPGGTLRIGAINPHSGALQYYGNHTLWSFYAGLQYKGDDGTSVPGPDAGAGEYTVEVGDVTYEILVGDTQASPDEAQTLAEDYVASENVDMLVGCTSSASARTVASNVANQANVPLMVAPAAAVSITGSAETCSDNVFRANENVAMDAQSGGRYVAEATDIESVWIYYANYSFGEDVRTNYKRVLEANGISIDGETALAPDYSEDWEGQLDKAADAGSDGIVTGFTVAALPALFTVFLNNPDRYPFRAIGGLTTYAGAAALGGTVQSVLGEDFTADDLDELGMGPFTTRYHWNQYDNDINSAFTDFYTEQYGFWPDLFSGGAFTASSAIHQAIQETGDVSGDGVRQGLKGLTVQDTPKGENGYQFQEYDNQARSAMTVAPVIPTREDAQQFWPNAAMQPGDPVEVFDMSQTTPGPDSDVITCDL